MKFVDLRLAEPIVRAVTAEGYVTATPIQAQAIPHVLDRRDLLGCAQTGTGKTAAFALPILQRLMQEEFDKAANADGVLSGGSIPLELRDPAALGHVAHPNTTFLEKPHNKVHGGKPQPDRFHQGRHAKPAPARRARALVLCPTRELAVQIADSFRTYGKNLPLRGAVIFGGVGQNPQVETLRRGVDIIVATPGRLLDLMEQGHCDLRSVEILVLDEADRMLDMGFIHDIKKIIAKLPARQQTLLFSATMPGEIRSLANSLMKNPVQITIAPESPAVDRIEQFVYHVEQRNKPTLLAHLINNTSMPRTIVFTRTKHGADRLVRHLFQRGIEAAAIHGDKAQNARQRALDNFQKNKVAILVATDIASRGIDVDGITHVVNYDLTHEPETYVHRIGRTARAGASGIAISFCGEGERGNLRAIERLIRRPIPVKEDHPRYPLHTESTGHGGGSHGNRRPQSRGSHGQASQGHSSHEHSSYNHGANQSQHSHQSGEIVVNADQPRRPAHSSRYKPSGFKRGGRR